ncbi:MAG: DUF512 domain-containing protein [Lachnospiraceae bacterium]|nr:DUF512 domain-containing protein [Lachnospiraceae bacterium]
MRGNGHKIIRVRQGSIAEEMGVLPGMYLVSVNGSAIEDIFDYQFLMDDEEVRILIREEDGEEALLEIEKEPEEDFGVEFENSLMDEYRSCCNRCIFCFIDQMPPGMRDTLYFKDDDSRLSFLQGNYVTLTNMKDKDIDRIIRYHMEPINISVHTTNPVLRRSMLGNRFAGDVFPKIRRLCDAGITMNGQIVLCKGINDGAELERSIRDLATYRPAMQSVSIVPAGLTKYRDGLAELEPFDAASAGEVIDLVEKWQRTLAAENPLADSPHFVHASDEWYILAGREMPEAERYDGYLQLENGVGMVRLMEAEVRAELVRLRKASDFSCKYQQGGAESPMRDVESGFIGKCSRSDGGFVISDKSEMTPHLGCRRVAVATGVLMHLYLKQFSKWIMEEYPGVDVRICPIKNEFFGERITVSGLVTGRDLISQLKDLQSDGKGGDALGDELLIPVNMLRSGERVFLDDITTDDVERELGIPVRVVSRGGDEFVRAVLGLPTEIDKDRQTYELEDLQ